MQHRCRNWFRDRQLWSFLHGRMELCGIFTILTAVQSALAVMNYQLSKKTDKSESVSEDIE